MLLRPMHGRLLLTVPPGGDNSCYGFAVLSPEPMWGKDLLSPGPAAPLTLPSTNISTLGRRVLPTPVLNATWGSC